MRTMFTPLKIAGMEVKNRTFWLRCRWDMKVRMVL